MKKFMSVFWKVCAGLFLLGAIMVLITGAIGGGSMVREIVRSNMTVWPWHCLGSFNENHLSLEIRDNDYPIMEGNVEKREIGNGSELEELNVELDAGLLNIEPTEGNSVYVSSRNAANFQCYIEDNTLYFAGFENDPGDFVNFDSNMAVTIYLPENLQLNQVLLRVDAGELDMNGVQAANLEADMDAGALKMKEMQVGNAIMDLDMGEMIYEGEVTGNLTGSVDMGDLKCQLAGSEQDYDYTIDCDMGSVTVGGNSYSGFSTTQESQSGMDRQIDLECSMGNITVRFDK
ncbi:MAG: DUF4097 family beta strand repeat-containing protein [Lachnospiraceae bacterium]|nr:DUF4097 family beta strand repeat-containing protein [Lachnospiraceae bacterium]